MHRRTCVCMCSLLFSSLFSSRSFSLSLSLSLPPFSCACACARACACIYTTLTACIYHVHVHAHEHAHLLLSPPLSPVRMHLYMYVCMYMLGLRHVCTRAWRWAGACAWGHVHVRAHVAQHSCDGGVFLSRTVDVSGCGRFFMLKQFLYLVVLERLMNTSPT